MDLTAALKCWLQEMLATEIAMALPRHRGGIAAAATRGIAAATPRCRRGAVAATTWRRCGDVRRGAAQGKWLHRDETDTDDLELPKIARKVSFCACSRGIFNYAASSINTLSRFN